MAFDFDAAVSAPFRMQPGLRRLAPGAHHLTPAVVPHRGAARHLREKLAVLGAYPQQALLCVPGFNPDPALQALAEHAAAEQPQAFQATGAQRRDWHAPWLGWRIDADDQPQATARAWPEIGSLLAARPASQRRATLLALAFAEDFALIDAATGSLPWLCVALPSMWAPEDKIGRHFAQVHAPVADNRLLVAGSSHLVRLVTGGERWERFVWTITGQPRLHAHPQRVGTPRWPARFNAEMAADQAWWRTERQTFIPLPGLGQAVFTIAVDTQPLHRALARADQAARVHAALSSMSPAVLAYRGLSEVLPALLQWLARRAEDRWPDPASAPALAPALAPAPAPDTGPSHAAP